MDDQPWTGALFLVVGVASMAKSHALGSLYARLFSRNSDEPTFLAVMPFITIGAVLLLMGTVAIMDALFGSGS